MIIGHLGLDPELRYTPSGRPVASFSVATSRPGRRRFNVVAWGNLAEICKTHLSKNQQVYVEGRLQTRGWEDEHGTRHYRTELVANEMISPGERHPVQEAGRRLPDDDSYPF
jgi:single-strand DNA-binding protein